MIASLLVESFLLPNPTPPPPLRPRTLLFLRCGGMDSALWGICAANVQRELDESPENWIGGFEQGP
jgi:hypothetical protein